MREQPYLHLDEISYTYLANGERKVVWVWASEDTIYYELALSRGKQFLEKLIPDPGEMIAAVDGWGHIVRNWGLFRGAGRIFCARATSVRDAEMMRVSFCMNKYRIFMFE